jgi:hypothetical protein
MARLSAHVDNWTRSATSANVKSGDPVTGLCERRDPDCAVGTTPF